MIAINGPHISNPRYNLVLTFCDATLEGRDFMVNKSWNKFMSSGESGASVSETNLCRLEPSLSFRSLSPKPLEAVDLQLSEFP